MLIRLAAFLSVSVALVAQAPQPVFEPMQAGLFATPSAFANAFADYDNDGDPDLFVGFDGKPNRLYRNDKGVFTDVAAAAGVADARPTRAVAWGDYDADGDADLLVGFTPSPNASVLKVYRNDAGKFSDVAATLGIADTRRTVGAVWFDYDEDGDLDLADANMDGDTNGLYRNDGGKFTDVAGAAGVAWGGRAPKRAGNGTVRVCAPDVDNDGRFDLFAANYGPLGFFSNRGKGVFEDRGAAWGIAIDSRYDACAFADFDHDGRLDLYVNGTVTGGAGWQDSLFRNTGSAFDDVTPPSIRRLQADHGVQWGDVDGDGDLDLALTGSRAADGMHLVMRNGLPAADAGRGLHVRVVDDKGRATLAGAEVRVSAAGTTRLIGARLVDSGSGYDAQNDLPVHVGVPSGVSRVDVQVIAPRHGKRVPVWQRGVAPGKTVTIRVPR